MSELGTVVVLPAGSMTPDEAAQWIAEPARSAVENIIEVGRRLNAAKGQVPHGSWGRVLEKLPFSEVTATRLMRIAGHTVLANPAHAQDLPPAWTTLDALARVPAEYVPDLIHRHVIHPDLTRAQAEEIANKYEAAAQAALDAWSECVDQITGALSYFESEFTPPRTLPDTYVTPAKALARARAVVKHLEGIAK